MSHNDNENTTVFPLIDATAIIPTKSDETPDEVDCMYALIVDTPGQPRGQFGPVKAWRDTNAGDNVWRINVPHSIECIPGMKERIDNLVDAEAWKNGDPLASIIAGKVKKDQYSWDALVNAYKVNDTWARNVIGLLQETFSQSSMMWWVAFPSVNSDSARMILALSEVDNEKRKHLEEDVEGFIIASSVMDEYASKSHNSSARKNAQLQLDAYTDQLLTSLQEHLEGVAQHEYTADDGTVFLR